MTVTSAVNRFPLLVHLKDTALLILSSPHCFLFSVSGSLKASLPLDREFGGGGKEEPLTPRVHLDQAKTADDIFISLIRKTLAYTDTHPIYTYMWRKKLEGRIQLAFASVS